MCHKIAYTQGLISYHDEHLYYKLQIKLFIQRESIYVKQFSQNWKHKKGYIKKKRWEMLQYGMEVQNLDDDSSISNSLISFSSLLLFNSAS
jgi:hypothetical protein